MSIILDERNRYEVSGKYLARWYELYNAAFKYYKKQTEENKQELLNQLEIVEKENWKFSEDIKSLGYRK